MILFYYRSDKVVKRVQKILLIIGVILFVVVYLGYKGFNYILYNSENISDKSYNEYMNSFKLHDDMVVSKKDIDGNFLVFRNIKIRNDFTDYVVRYESEDSKVYQLDDKNGNEVAIFRISIAPKNIDSLLDEPMFDEKDKEDFFKKYNIASDLDLLNFVLEKHNVNSTIFTPVKIMKEHAMIQHFTYMTLSNPSFVSKITGDYNGYLIGNEKVSQSSSFKNINTVFLFGTDKNYIFSFWINDDFDEEYIKDIIETVVIEDKDIDTFIRTYQVIDVEKQEDSNKTYLTLKQFQLDEVTKVEVYNSFLADLKLENGKYYEFRFQYNGNKVEDNIKSIFENTNLISITETDKLGLDQVQDNIK